MKHHVIELRMTAWQFVLFIVLWNAVHSLTIAVLDVVWPR